MQRYGLKPSKVASKMGVTAAAITQYEKSMRGASFIKALNGSKRISKAIDDLVDSVNGEDYLIDELIRKLCDICVIVRSEGLICELHRDELSAFKEFKCEVCE
jgi:predicted transcriptional regulator